MAKLLLLDRSWFNIRRQLVQYTIVVNWVYNKFRITFVACIIVHVHWFIGCRSRVVHQLRLVKCCPRSTGSGGATSMPPCLHVNVSMTMSPCLWLPVSMSLLSRPLLALQLEEYWFRLSRYIYDRNRPLTPTLRQSWCSLMYDVY